MRSLSRVLFACAATSSVVSIGGHARGALESAEARVAAARTQAQTRRFDEAIAAFRAVLAEDPRNADARAGLVDALIWSGQLDLADRELDVGLAYDRSAPALLARRAKVLQLRGDVALGRRYLERAERAWPSDGDLRALGDRMWLGEGRFRLRNDFYPQGWDDQPTSEISALQRAGRGLLGVRTEQSSRYPSAYGVRAYNAFYAAMLSYALAPGWAPGLEAGFGAPARAVPSWLARAFLYFPVAGPVDGHASISWLRYPSGTSAQVMHPSLGLALGERVRLEGRYWLARATAPDVAARLQHSFGVRVVHRPVRELAIEGHWVFGTQAERLSNVDQLASIRSQFFGVALDVHPVRAVGVRPLYEVELRKNPRGDLITIHGAEIAVYARW